MKKTAIIIALMLFSLSIPSGAKSKTLGSFIEKVSSSLVRFDFSYSMQSPKSKAKMKSILKELTSRSNGRGYEKRKQNSPSVKETPYALYKYSGYMGELPTDPNKYLLIAGNVADDDEACKLIRKREDAIPYLRMMGPDMDTGSYWFDFGSYTEFYLLTKNYLGG